MRLAALLLCLSACAAPSGAFMDGAPVRVAPVEPMTRYTPPGTGLPEYWGSPAESPRVEPGPKPTRVLPQTPETMKGPGIWASDGEPPGDPSLFGVSLPLPPSLKGDVKSAFEVRSCAASMGGIATEAGISSVPDDVQRCLAMRLVHYCLFNRTKAEKGTQAAIESPLVGYYRRAAEAACRGLPPSNYDKAERHITAIWRKRNIHDDGPAGL